MTSTHDDMPLPDPAIYAFQNDSTMRTQEVCGWSADQMRAYAAAAVAAEREACALICESVNNFDNPMTANDCAAAIRARGQT